MNFIKDFNFKKAIPYILIIIGFIVIAYAYTPQVLQGKIVNQSDISSWRGMANEIITYNEAHPDDETLWTNSMFSGMPAVTISANHKGDYTEPFYNFLLIGARPASYLLISLIGGFLLFLAFGTNIYLAAIGAIAITFCSYNMQIIQVGHNTKMLAIAFMPWVLAAVVYSYRRKNLWGPILFGLALSFQIKANHPQITYYLAIIIFGYVLAEFCSALKNKTFKPFLKTSMIVLATGLLGIATNATKLLPTLEYSKYTMRGGSELSIDEEQKTGGLQLDYATAWSYGINETPNLMIPDFNGGSSVGALDHSSATYKVLSSKYQGADSIIKQLPLYWGPQPFTAGPMYMGALCVFLFVLGLFIIKGRYKWWILGVSLLALFLAWGSHFMWFSEFFFKYVPLYNKFRTVSMALVVLQITIPILAILTIKELLDEHPSTQTISKKKISNRFIASLCITAGFALFFILMPSLAGNFSSTQDGSLPADITAALSQDRISLLRSDALRSILFILLGASVLWLGYLKKLKLSPCLAIIGVLILIDLWGVDKRYLNDSHFIRQRDFQNQFAKRPVDDIILQDENPYYRVLDLTVNTFNDAHVSYHHKTIGGYSPAKLQRYQDIIDHYILPEISSHVIPDINNAAKSAKTVEDINTGMKYYPILSMLNTKYIVRDSESYPIVYSFALGNAWFVSNAIIANNPDEEIALLGEIDPKTTAVLCGANLPEVNDAEGSIVLTDYAPNRLKYTSTSPTGGVAVFSDIYYPAGWYATIDGAPVEILRANYILRALNIPQGEHKIEFWFAPKSFETGKTISIISSLILLLSCVVIIILSNRPIRRS